MPKFSVIHEVKIIGVDEINKTITIEKITTGVKYKIKIPKYFNLENYFQVEKYLCRTAFVDGEYTYFLEPLLSRGQSPVEANNQAIGNPQKYQVPHYYTTRKEIISVCELYGLNDFYHITRIENLTGIFAKGLLCRNQMKGFIDISNHEIQDYRHYKHLPQYPDLTLHDFIPLFIAPKPPMLSVLREIQNSIVYICISTDVLQLPCSVFTDGNARSNDTSFFVNINDFSRLDWEILHSTYWGSHDAKEHQENKRRRSAEVLIRHSIPMSYINGILVSCSPTMEKVNEIIINAGIDINATCVPEFYY